MSEERVVGGFEGSRMMFRKNRIGGTKALKAGNSEDSGAYDV